MHRQNFAHNLDKNIIIQFVFLFNDPLNSMEIFELSNQLDV